MVEILVAMTLAGTVALLVHLAVVTASDLSTAAAERDARVQRASAIRRQIADWLHTVRPPSGSPRATFRVVDQLASGESDDELVLPVQGDGMGLDAPAVIRLRIDRDRGTPEVGLVAELEDRAGPVDHAGRIELVPEATALEVEVLSAASDPRWQGHWKSVVRLPRAVRLHLSGDSLPPLLARPMSVSLAIRLGP